MNSLELIGSTYSSGPMNGEISSPAMRSEKAGLFFAGVMKYIRRPLQVASSRRTRSFSSRLVTIQLPVRLVTPILPQAALVGAIILLDERSERSSRGSSSSSSLLSCLVSISVDRETEQGPRFFGSIFPKRYLKGVLT